MSAFHRFFCDISSASTCDRSQKGTGWREAGIRKFSLLKKRTEKL